MNETESIKIEEKKISIDNIIKYFLLFSTFLLIFNNWVMIVVYIIIDNDFKNLSIFSDFISINRLLLF